MDKKKNGTAQVKDLAAILKWYRELPIEKAFELMEEFKKWEGHSSKVNPVDTAINDLFSIRGWYISHPPSGTAVTEWEAQRERNAQRLEQFIRFSEDFKQPLHVGHWEPKKFAFLYMGNSEMGVIIPHPEQWLIYSEPVDYSTQTAAEVRAALDVPRLNTSQQLIPVDAESALTVADVSSILDDKKSILNSLEAQMDDVRHAKTAELASVQQKIDKLKEELQEKQAAAMAELDAKKAEMEQAVEIMENQIYLLDSQIYAIRCFAGETVSFTQIRKGKNAPNDEPVVVHQKLRFLDEDLGRLASLYEIQWDRLGMFEEFLRHSPVALDTFAPNDRCIMLVRLSRTGRKLGMDDRYPYANMMTEYNYYHGKTVGIIIRNGENLYIGWTDEDRVHIDDDLIISKVVTDVQPAEEPEFNSAYTREQDEKRQRQQAKALLDGIISRSFVYNILQGIVEHSTILPLPEGVTLGKQSQYVLYSVADKWLTDNRFGAFTDIIQRCNEKIAKGDILLTVQRLVAEREGSWRTGWGAKPWQNTRGRGERNRTHDVAADDCTLYPANLVEFDDPIDMVRYKVKLPTSRPSISEEDKYSEFTSTLRDFKRLDHAESTMILEQYQRRDRHIFISLKKRDDWSYEGQARANFEVYPSEFINLTYMNSVWLEWVINTKSMGGWKISGKPVNYGYAIKYLKTALDFVKKREADEEAAINTVSTEVCKDPDWPVKLSEWKLKNEVRVITPYQARRFVKAIGGDV